LSRQCIEALKELNFSMSESMTDIEFIQKGKKYILQILRIFQRGMSELVN